MYQRPAFTGIGKHISILIVVTIVLIVIVFFIQILNQKKRENKVRLIKGNGILVKKKDLSRGSFSITLKTSNKNQEFDLLGYDFFFDKIEIGDSLSKHEDSMMFDVYRKHDSLFLFKFTIGYY